MSAQPRDATTDPRCPICGSDSRRIAIVDGRYSGRGYALQRCDACRFAFIGNPWLEFDQIYDERYYAGKGADPLVDYDFELGQPDLTVRQYEWRGIRRVLDRLTGGVTGLRCLDYGCGNGGLVRYLAENTAMDPVGFEDGYIAERARALGIPILRRAELDEQPEGRFDVVTAIEVLEHTTDPVAELRDMRRLLKRGGLLFVTTGNAAPFAARLAHWSYVIPEIHVSFFEPATLSRAMDSAGFRPARLPPGGGFDEILKFKVLKNLGVRRRGPITDAIPARCARLADRRVRLREHPIGWAV